VSVKAPRNNRGIIITGGSVNADQMVAGTRAKAINIALESGFDTSPNLTAFRDAVAELTNVLIRHEHDTLDSNKALESIAALVEEARKPKPKSSKLEELLAKVASFSGPVASIVQAIASVSDVITKAF
jgi:flagellar basal body P-ring protein FlgI